MIGFQKINEANLENSLSLFWAHGDNVLSSTWGARLPYNKEDLRLLLNFHTLFAEKLCVVDAGFLHNKPLKELLMYDGYDTLLSESVIVPMLRKSVNNFIDLEYNLREMGRYGLLNEVEARTYAEFLNDKVKTIFPTEDIYFTEVLTEYYENSLLNSNFLIQAGLQDIQKDLVEFIKSYQKKYGLDSIWRSLFFYFADELTKKRHPKYAMRLKWFSAAIWNNVFLNAIPAKPAFPHSYLEAINKVLEKNKDVIRIDIEQKKQSLTEEITLSLDDIQHLNAHDLIDIRKTSEAKSYFKKIKRAEKESDSIKSRNMYLEAQELYLASLSDQLALIGIGKYKKVSRARRGLRIIKWTSTGGKIGIALSRLAFSLEPIFTFAFLGAALVWNFGGHIIESKVEKKITDETLRSRQQWEDIKRSMNERRPIINVAKNRRGLNPPLF